MSDKKKFVIFGTVEMNWCIEVEGDDPHAAARTALGRAHDGMGLDSHAGPPEISGVYVVGADGMLTELHNDGDTEWPESDEDDGDPDDDGDGEW